MKRRVALSVGLAAACAAVVHWVAGDALRWVGRDPAKLLGASQTTSEFVADVVHLVVTAAASVVVLTLGLLIARVTAPGKRTERAAEDDVDPTAVKAFVEIGNTATLAEQAVRLFWEKETWIYRRVERISFLNRTLVRRRISVDFEIPTSVLQVKTEDDGPVRRFLPISVLRSWPPVLNLDLRDAADRPIPLLSKAATNKLDEDLLTAIGRDAIGDAVDELGDMLHRIVHRDDKSARDAHVVLREAVSDDFANHQDAEVGRYENFIDLAAVLIDSTMLWVPVDKDADVGDRAIVKIAYDEPVRRHLLRFRSLLTSLSWRATVVAFDVPHIGDANSYHLELEAPPSLEIVGARLTLEDDDHPPGLLRRAWSKIFGGWAMLERQMAIALGRPLPQAQQQSLRRSAEIVTQRAHLYISGDRRRAVAQATLQLVAERAGTLTAAALIGMVCAALTTGFEAISLGVYAAATSADPKPITFAGSLSLLLVPPTLLTYVLVRVGEHEFARRLIAGVRGAALVATALPVTSAAALVWAVADRRPDAVEDVARWAMRASWLVAAVLLMSWLLPLRRSWRRSD